MNKETLKKVILEFQERPLPDSIERDLSPDLRTGRPVTLTGPRRTGKTYLLFNSIKHLLACGTPIEDIVYINFEDLRLYPFDARDFETLLEAYLELYPEHHGRVHLFLDEVQAVEGWERGVRHLYDSGNIDIFLTGSSSKMLTTEIGSVLRGRTIQYSVLPFSFKEALRAKGIVADERATLSSKRFQIKRAFLDHMRYGGYPEVVMLAKSEDSKIRTLQEYYNTILIKDIVERYKVRNVPLLKEMVRYLVTNISNRFSISRYHRSVKQRHGISKRTVLNYLSYLEDIRLIYGVKIYSPSLKVQNANPMKVYCVDTGFRTAIGFYGSEDLGAVAENLVFLELLHDRMSDPLIEIYYWSGPRSEADFVVRRGRDVTQVIQVSWDIDDEATRAREMRGLQDAMKALGVKRGLIITGDTDGEERVDGLTITYRPLWKWLVTRDAAASKRKR